MLEGLDFEAAAELAGRVFSYTNHTVMVEALEKWDMELLRSVVPDICDILEKLDARLKKQLPGSGLYLIKDGTVYMANLSVYLSTAVNGVAQIHSEILKNDLFRDWYRVYPERFQNKTNGITPRRWLGLCNPELCGLIESRVGGGFLTDLDKLEGLKGQMDEMTVKQFNAIKLEKKSSSCASSPKKRAWS
jgi:starch phosphorylase